MTDRSHASAPGPAAGVPDDALRETLGALAAGVVVDPGAYHQVRAEWLRRQRRRKRLGVLVAILVVAIADLVGVWALNRSDAGASLMFDDRPPAQVQDPAPAPAPVAPRIAQP